MRWTAFALLAYIFLALQVAIAPAMGLETRLGPVEPRFVLLLAVFVSLYAPAPTAMVGAVVLGALLDVTTTWPLPGDAGLTLLGPYALGHLAGAYLVLQCRPMLVRHHPLTLGVMATFGGAAVHLVVVALFTLRAWYEPLLDWSATGQLLVRTLSLLYTGLLGVLLAVPLRKLAPLLELQAGRKPAPAAARR